MPDGSTIALDAETRAIERPRDHTRELRLWLRLLDGRGPRRRRRRRQRCRRYGCGRRRLDDNPAVLLLHNHKPAIVAAGSPRIQTKLRM